MYHKIFGPIKIKTNWNSKSNNQSYKLSIRVTSNEQLILVVNKQGLRSMKMATKMLPGFGWIETRKSKIAKI